MKLKKIYKTILLFLFICFLTGCGWDDIYKKNKDVFDKGVECFYTAVSEDVKYPYVSKITLIGDSKGFYVSVNGGNKKTIISEKQSIAPVELDQSGYYLLFTDFELEQFLTDYNNLGTCPNKIYITGPGAVRYKKDKDTTPFEYKKIEKDNHGNGDTSSSDGDTGSEFDKSCLAENAIGCKNFTSKDARERSVYIQLGYVKGTEKNIEYFVVSYDEKFNDANPVFIYEDNNVYTAYDKISAENNHFWILDKKELFLDNNSFVESNNLFLNLHEGTSTSSETHYAISTKDDVYGDFNSSTKVEDYTIPDEEKQVELPEIELGKVTCATVFKDSTGNYNNTWKLLNTSLKFIQYLGIILALVLSIIDFIKVLPTQDKDALKKSTSKAVTRLVIAIVIFFVPLILNFILGLIGFNDPTCGLY